VSACSVPRVEGKPDFSWLKDRRVRALAVGCLIVGFLVAALIFGKPRHPPPNWGDIPTWLAVVVATVGGWIALSQLRGQQDVLRQDAEDRHRAQAARVYIGVPSKGERGPLVCPYVKNASDFPIYEAELWYLSLSPDGQLSGGDNCEYLGTIAPGDEPGGTQLFPSDEALRCSVLTFRDANNVWWIRMPGGVLKELSARPEPESVSAIVQTLPPELGPTGAWRYGRGQR
jgi:hypothetical protein